MRLTEAMVLMPATQSASAITPIGKPLEFGVVKKALSESICARSTLASSFACGRWAMIAFTASSSWPWRMYSQAPATMLANRRMAGPRSLIFSSEERRPKLGNCRP